MSVIDKRTKGKVAMKAAKAAAKRPRALLVGTKIAVPAGRAGVRASMPLLKRRARRRVERVDRVSRALGEALAVYAPRTAYELGLAEPPKPKRTAPRLAAGAVIGASAMYLFEPRHGREHREKVMQLVG